MHKANDNMNSHLIPNPEKSNYKIIIKTRKKKLIFGYFGTIVPIFWLK